MTDSFDALTENARRWTEFIDAHRPADQLDADQRPDDAVTDLGGLARGNVTIRDTRPGGADESHPALRADLLGLEQDQPEG